MCPHAVRPVVRVDEECEGSEIVCPDGHVRNYPYHDHDDAVCDAELLTAGAIACNSRLVGLGRRALPPCRGGQHSLRSVKFSHRDDA